MHTVFYEVFHLKQTCILCYEVFERNDIIKTTAARTAFLTNYTEHSINLKVKET